MSSFEPVKVKSKISRGGFSGERVFRIQLANGETHVGACPLQYCYNRSGQNLSDEQPPHGKSTEGKIEARIIREEDDDKVLISVPDGEVVIVAGDQITRPPREASPDVSVQS